MYVIHTNLNGPLAVEIFGKSISKVLPLLAIELFRFNIISGMLWSTSISVISGSIEIATGKCNTLWKIFQGNSRDGTVYFLFQDVGSYSVRVYQTTVYITAVML